MMLSDKLQAIWNQFSDAEKQAIDARYQQERQQYLTLQEIRKQQQITQKDLAKLLGINQENVSRMERRDDMRLSTLKEYIEALGGEIQINAIFPDHETVTIINS